jgi:peptidyl-tRNA hydrolase
MLGILEMYEEIEDTKGLIRIRISKKNRQHNGQKKISKRTNNDLQSAFLNIVFLIDNILFFAILQKSVVKMINKILFYTT